MIYCSPCNTASSDNTTIAFLLNSPAPPLLERESESSRFNVILVDYLDPLPPFDRFLLPRQSEHLIQPILVPNRFLLPFVKSRYEEQREAERGTYGQTGGVGFVGFTAFQFVLALFVCDELVPLCFRPFGQCGSRGCEGQRRRYELEVRSEPGVEASVVVVLEGRALGGEGGGLSSELRTGAERELPLEMVVGTNDDSTFFCSARSEGTGEDSRAGAATTTACTLSRSSAPPPTKTASAVPPPSYEESSSIEAEPTPFFAWCNSGRRSGSNGCARVGAQERGEDRRGGRDRWKAWASTGVSTGSESVGRYLLSRSSSSSARLDLSPLPAPSDPTVSQSSSRSPRLNATSPLFRSRPSYYGSTSSRSGAYSGDNPQGRGGGGHMGTGDDCGFLDGVR